MSVRTLVPLVCVLLSALGAYAQTATLLRDINTTVDASFSSDPHGLVAWRGAGYFFASSTRGVRGLWRTDGSAAGTRLIKNHLNGRHLIVSGDKLFFVGNDEISGWELWSSDGSTAGTVLVKDIGDGFVDGVSPDRGLLAVDGTAFFIAGDFGVGLTLWKSDGAEAGTTPLLSVDPDLPSSIGLLDGANGVAYFYANDGVNGSELWKTDGTPAGTVLVRDTRPGPEGSYPQGSALLGGTLFFFADDGLHGYELWKSDGTMIGTSLVADLNPGAEGSWSSDFFARLLVGNDLYFAADNGDGSGVGLWKRDGTAVGTKRILAGVNPQDLATTGNLVYFVVNDGLDAPSVLWRTDGTTAGTGPVREFVSIGSLSGSFDGSLFFSASEGDVRSQLWKTDGSPGGTVLVKQINTTGSADLGGFTVLRPNTFVSGTLVFRASDSMHGAELWKTNGSEAGTVLVKDLGAEAGSSNPDDFTPIGSELYFTAVGDTGEREQWKTDGTVEGTVPAAPLPPAPQAPGFFSYDDGIHGSELWILDDALGSPRLVKDINPGAPGSVSSPLDGFSIRGTFFFAANDGLRGRELWKSDGTEAGTVLVRDIYTLISTAGIGSSPQMFVDLNGVLVFRAYGDSGSPSELWRSDGSAAGTVLIQSLQHLAGPTGRHNFVQQPVVHDGLLYLLTWSPSGHYLFRTDGTTGGTILLKAQPGAFQPTPELLEAGGSVFFSFTGSVEPKAGPNAPFTRQGAVWRTDGTLEGTVLISSFDPVDESTVTVSQFTNYGDELHFLVRDSVGRGEIWKVDGAEGSVQAASLPVETMSVNRIIGVHTGTLFLDVQEGAGPMSLHHLARLQGLGETIAVDDAAFTLDLEMIEIAGSHVFFVGRTPETGDELWALPLQPAISSSGVVDAAAYLPTLAPGGLASLFGVELAGGTAAAAGFPLRTTLAGAKVKVNGINAPLLFASPTQINFQVPYETPLGASISVVASLNGQQSLSKPAAVARFAPAIFVNPATGEPIVLRHADGSLISSQNPAQPGETLIVYVTGIGGLDNPPPTGAAATDLPLAMATTPPIVFVGGLEVGVRFAGLAPGFAGLGQINIELPRALPQGSPLPFTIHFGDKQSPILELPF